MLLPGATGLNGSGQPTTLGVMGGGQLGRMFVQAAQAMGYFTVVLDPDVISPAGLVSHYHIKTDYLDQQGLTQLLQRCAAVTTEFENVPAPALVTLGAARPTAPSADAVAIAQDRIKEKAHLARSGVPVAPYAVIETAAQLTAVEDALLPGILKTARLGYDGKGQVRCNSRAELTSAWDALKNVPCVLEQMLPLAAECSVIVARGWDGSVVHFAPQLNVHRDGILAVTEAYAGNMPPALADQAVAAARAIAEELNYVGVLCVEFFVLQEGSPERAALGGLVVNEMAPRPHNSGHYTLDACDVSQFDLQVRTLAGLPLTQPRQHSAAVMLNLLGDLWVDGATPRWDRVLALPGVHLHLYGKLTASKGRKMGHLTVTAATPEQARSAALEAASVLGIAPF
ncbi:MAG: 5-(carboxyamino)imidazole ribonucleotide synthase [Rhodoferax sp.]|uniref:5-(carboxyamino)imidazole ribonucleotide synthase n=1 Tax=Rhodoferax sp. TaxID=50421 RepID=UPI003BB5EE3F